VVALGFALSRALLCLRNAVLFNIFPQVGTIYGVIANKKLYSQRLGHAERDFSGSTLGGRMGSESKSHSLLVVVSTLLIRFLETRFLLRKTVDCTLLSPLLPFQLPSGIPLHGPVLILDRQFKRTPFLSHFIEGVRVDATIF